MNGPSKNWKRIRLAVLERAHRVTIEPLETLSTIYVAVCVYYFVGFLRFKYFDHTATFTPIESVQIVTVALSGLLILPLTGSVLTLHFASQRLKKLANE
jgi:hypothetical protein